MKNRNKGFTLLEVIISLGLIGAISLASVGIFSGYLSIGKKTAQFNNDTALLFSALNENSLEEGMSQITETVNINLGSSGMGSYYIVLKRKTIRMTNGDGSGVSYYEY